MNIQVIRQRHVKSHSHLTFMQRFRNYLRDSQLPCADGLLKDYTTKERAEFERYIQVIERNPYNVHTRINYRVVAMQFKDWRSKQLHLERTWRTWAELAHR